MLTFCEMIQLSRDLILYLFYKLDMNLEVFFVRLQVLYL